MKNKVIENKDKQRICLNKDGSCSGYGKHAIQELFWKHFMETWNRVKNQRLKRMK